MINCPKCNASNGDANSFCGNCGANLKGENGSYGNVPYKSDSSFMKFLRFDVMITPMFITVLYVIVSIIAVLAIFCSSLVMLRFGMGNAFISIVIGIPAALIVIRIVFETIINLFKQTELQKKIYEEISKKD